MPHLIFLGTSHIAEQSIRAIRKAVKDYDPDLIAVELDKQRLHALLADQRPNYSPILIAKVGLKGYLFAVIGGVLQRRLGKMVGMRPGADMKHAALLAKKHKKPLALIDQDLTTTLRNLSRKLTRKERWRFLTDILFGWAKKQPKVKIDLKQVPTTDLITKLIAQLKDRYPTFYQVLVDDRNKYMARRLLALTHAHPDKTILVVIGAGHIQGIQEHFTTIINNSDKNRNN
ncbi:TraB/GumN family protein [Candidatus Woesearchaeota archaeon]|nr:TraB/GumN family protein [Candidatus Woesearchaeota archaeon]